MTVPHSKKFLRDVKASPVVVTLDGHDSLYAGLRMLHDLPNFRQLCFLFRDASVDDDLPFRVGSFLACSALFLFQREGANNLRRHNKRCKQLIELKLSSMIGKRNYTSKQ